MSLRIIQIHTSNGDSKALLTAIEGSNVIDKWKLDEEGERILYSLLVPAGKTQEIIDKLQVILGHSEQSRITILPVETTIPKLEEAPKEKPRNGKKSTKSLSREELYEDMTKGIVLDGNFMLLVVFSTIVAAIGLLEDNVAVVIGAMVIAPLLGPNLALALATALGDMKLMGRAIKTNLVGVTTCIILSFIIGKLWPYGLESRELFLRTVVGFDGIALALASGAAAVLSLTTGISSVLVGVMVSVALLPPASTMGIMLGAGNNTAATGAALLLAVNIVCVNLSAKLVFISKGIRPRSWYEKQTAYKAMLWYITFWAISLLVLGVIIYLQVG